MDFARASSLPWLQDAQAALLRLREQSRLPHALLILAREGVGAEWLAQWMAAVSLCESAAAPCGQCASCTLLRADSHPDLHRVEREEDAQQVKIEQVRELIDALHYTSYRGGYKVGVLFGAERLNAAGANAFLKTLEEPPPQTLLMLVATPNHRLPATIASRCQKLPVPIPETSQAIAWLGEQGIERPEAALRLALAQGAPLVALEFSAEIVQSVTQEMSRDLAQLEAVRADPSLAAERWLKSEFPLRLMWLENWITDRVRTLSAGDAASLKSVDAVGLPGALLKAKIRTLFRFLDDVRELKRLVTTSVNMQLALEGVLIRQFIQDR